jgi:hypothetical protein
MLNVLDGLNFKPRRFKSFEGILKLQDDVRDKAFHGFEGS